MRICVAKPAEAKYHSEKIHCSQNQESVDLFSWHTPLCNGRGHMPNIFSIRSSDIDVEVELTQVFFLADLTKTMFIKHCLTEKHQVPAG